jgi:hypothetical protein
VTCRATTNLRVRVGVRPGTAGFCWTQCNVCIALGRGLPYRQDVLDVLVAEHRKHLGLPDLPPPPAPWPVRLPALPTVLINRHRAADLVHRYFAGRNADGTPLYTGSMFERIGGGGERSDVVDVFTTDDLVAVSMLNGHVPAQAALRLLNDAARLSALLADIPAGLDLVDADEEHVAVGCAADRLWRELSSFPGIGPITAYKLLARKRPRLLAVLDSVARRVLGHPGTGYWRNLQGELKADDGRLAEHLAAIRVDAGLDGSISIVRVFDVLVWMTGKGALSTASLRTLDRLSTIEGRHR